MCFLPRTHPEELVMLCEFMEWMWLALSHTFMSTPWNQDKDIDRVLLPRGVQSPVPNHANNSFARLVLLYLILSISDLELLHPSTILKPQS